METKHYIVLGFALALFSQVAQALKERHLVIIRHGESEHNIAEVLNSNPNHPHYKPSHLTELGRKQATQTAELLLTYGFDNRSISAVLVSPLPRALETANVIAKTGVYDAIKIQTDARLIECQAGDKEGASVHALPDHEKNWFVSKEVAFTYHGESNVEVRQRVLSIYDELDEKYPQGHIIFITDGIPAMELIQGISKDKVKLQTGQVYLLPIVKRKPSVA